MEISLGPKGKFIEEKMAKKCGEVRNVTSSTRKKKNVAVRHVSNFKHKDLFLQLIFLFRSEEPSVASNNAGFAEASALQRHMLRASQDHRVLSFCFVFM